MSAIGDILATVNSDIGTTLDVLIKEKTNIKIQTVTFDYEPYISTTSIKNIIPVDISKTIIVPIVTVIPESVISFSINFIDNETISSSVTHKTNGVRFSFTVQLITFGATVL